MVVQSFHSSIINSSQHLLGVKVFQNVNWSGQAIKINQTLTHHVKLRHVDVCIRSHLQAMRAMMEMSAGKALEARENGLMDHLTLNWID